MSQASLKVLLEKLKKDLENSKEFREYSNKEAHTFYLSKGKLTNQVYEQLKADNIPFKKEEVREEVSKYFDKWVKKAEGLVRRGYRSGVIPEVSKVEKGFINLVFLKSKTEQDIFNKIRRHKQTAQKEFYNYLETLYEGKWNPANFLDITHEETSVVARQRVQAVQKELTKFTTTLSKEDIAILEKDRNINLTLIKDDARDIVSVSLGSAYLNRQQSTKDKKFLILAKRRLEKAILRLEKDILTTSGSDSFTSKKRKQIIKKVADPFKKVKGVKVKTENTKIVKSSKTPVTTDIPVEIKNGTSTTIDKQKRKLLKPKNKPTVTNLNSLLPLLDTRVKKLIFENMVYPALVNRTGRFANSVRVTDITQTPQGYPSIGYTYQYNPYRVFEYPTGKPNLATKDRDPRSIIDKTIRQAAIGLINQRFYTRRV